MAGETAVQTRTIKASSEQVWAVVGDVTRMPEWSEELVSVEVLEGDGRSPGSRFRGHNRRSSGGGWSMTCVIDDYIECERLAFHTENVAGQERTRWWYEIAPDGSGATTVTEGFLRVAKMGAIRSFLERRVIGDRTEHNLRNMEASLRRLATLVEGA